jgi:hypothetical protein
MFPELTALNELFYELLKLLFVCVPALAGAAWAARMMSGQYDRMHD